MDEKKIEIFLKNYKEAIEKTIGESFSIEMKKVKEVEELNERLYKTIWEMEDFIAEQKRALEEIKEDLKPLEAYDIVKTINSKINKILKRC